MDRISLIGAPTDVGASVVGCRMGPAALSLAGLQASASSSKTPPQNSSPPESAPSPGARPSSRRRSPAA